MTPRANLSPSSRDAKERYILVPALIKQTRLPIEFRHIQTADLTEWKADEPSPEFDKVLAALDQLLERQPEKPLQSGRVISQRPDRIGLYVGKSLNKTLNLEGMTFLQILRIEHATQSISARLGWSQGLGAKGNLVGKLQAENEFELVGIVSSLQTGAFDCRVKCRFVDPDSVEGENFLDPRPWNFLNVKQAGKFVLKRQKDSS